MEIQIKWHSDQFNVALASKEGAEPFIEIKGVRIASGSDGEFVSWPATKNPNTNKWWRHVYASDKFNAAVLEKAKAGRPQQASRRQAVPDDIDF